MNRRAFVTGLGAVLAAPSAADVQVAGKVGIGFSLPFPSRTPTRMRFDRRYATSGISTARTS